MARPASSYRSARRTASARAVTPGAAHDPWAEEMVRQAFARRQAGQWPGMSDAALDRMLASIRAANGVRFQAQQAERDKARAEFEATKARAEEAARRAEADVLQTAFAKAFP